ncbi:hypothetical protein GE09DRAFT_1185770 [Coniochaeta sp. 2T2.1]|nr:hypothetical protein GE09DRAFT_1185770 [Coniochaeta sp. 2T2.1]
MTNFSTLPAELRLMIMGELNQLLPSSRAERRARGRYAAVSREWQAFFEPLFFAHLELDEIRVTHLIHLDPERQGLVKKISLVLYDRDSCPEPDCYCDVDHCSQRTECYCCYHDSSRREDDGEFWEEPVNDLFGALSTWEPPGRRLELELRVECFYYPEYSRSPGNKETMEVTCQPDMDGVKREIWKQCGPCHTRWW